MRRCPARAALQYLAGQPTEEPAVFGDDQICEWSNYLAHSGRAIWLSFEYVRGQVPVVYRIIAGRELAEPSRRSGQVTGQG